jgi:hypothetical protein
MQPAAITVLTRFRIRIALAMVSRAMKGAVWSARTILLRAAWQGRAP